MKKIKTDKVVIGSSLESVIYAFENNCTLLQNEVRPPFVFERFSPKEQIPLFENIPAVLNSPTGHETKGMFKVGVWNHLIFSLSCAGKLPFSDKIEKIRIVEEEKKIKVFTKRHRKFEIDCEKVIVFDPENVEGLPTIKKKIKDPKYLVVDWVDVKAGMVHEFDFIKTKDRFINEIVFYTSPRIDGSNHSYKDLAALSYLTREEMLDHSYSDLMTLYKVKDVMKASGIRGPRNGRDTKNPEKYKYYAIKLEMNRREVYKMEKDSYKDTEFVSFSKKGFEKVENSYLSMLQGYFQNDMQDSEE